MEHVLKEVDPFLQLGIHDILGQCRSESGYHRRLLERYLLVHHFANRVRKDDIYFS